MRSFVIALPFALLLAVPAQVLAASKTDTIVEQSMKQHNIPGLSLSIAFPGGKSATRSYGMADLERQVPVKEGSVFAIGSVTKVFTAISVMILQEDGKLSVDDPLSKYFPDYPRGNEITIKNLLQHTSGIKEFAESDPYKSNEMKYYSPLELVSIFEHQPLDFDPGTKSQYSNSGFVLLGLIVEKASGMPFEQFLARRITGPLGMTHTIMGSNSRLVANRVLGYAVSSGTLVNADPVDFATPYATGGILSTTADLAKFAKVFRGEAVLSSKSIAEMTAPVRLKDGSVFAQGKDRLMSYGYGLELAQSGEQWDATKAGVINGFGAFFIYAKKSDLLVAVTSNLDESTKDITACVIDVLKVFEGKAGAQVNAVSAENVRFDYYAWYTYDLSDHGRFLATVRTGERRYFRGHQHGVQPNLADLGALRTELYAAVMQAANAQGVAYPGNVAVLQGAQLRVRSEHI
jgi:CubicO group peptidase (beta-lactamase class C family)